MNTDIFSSCDTSEFDFPEATSDATRRAMRLIIQRLHMKSGNKPNEQKLSFIHPQKQHVYWYTL